jgi:hypothetical protein
VDELHQRARRYEEHEEKTTHRHDLYRLALVIHGTVVQPANR